MAQLSRSSAFLTLRLFNTVLVLWAPTIQLFSLILHNCILLLLGILNRSVNIWVFQWFSATLRERPAKGSFGPPRVCDPWFLRTSGFAVTQSLFET